MSEDNVQQDFDFGSVDQTAEAILASWEDADESQPSEEGELEATEDSTSEEETEVDETEEEEDEETKEEDETEEDPDDSQDTEEDAESEPEEIDLSDDTLVELQVDGETKQASLKDLKRLYGQEASLTRKSQETASQKKRSQ